MGKGKEALEKIHQARLILIKTIEEHAGRANVGESLKAQAETLSLLEKDFYEAIQNDCNPLEG